MAVFFTCIILMGSGLVVFALFLMLAEKRRMHDYRADIKEKKEDLIKVIEDAEMLIEEMNRFSDYVVTGIEDSHTRLQKSIHEADIRIECLSGQMEQMPVVEAPHREEAIDLPLEPKRSEEERLVEETELFKKGKVIPFDVKRREIIKLSRSGLDSTQIAKLLNIGKGEIELISKMAAK